MTRSPEQIAADLETTLVDPRRKQWRRTIPTSHLVLLREAAEALRAAEKVIEAARMLTGTMALSLPCPHCGEAGLSHLGTCQWSQMHGGDPRVPLLSTLAAWDARRST